MASDHVQFPAALVERHATAVDDVADTIAIARSAVRDVTMDAGAYGVLCGFLPAVLTPVFGLSLDALHVTIDALQETATNLRTTAASVSETDTAAAQRIRTAGPGAHTVSSERPLIELPL